MSYVSQQFLLFDNSSTANFKNWAQAISSAFSSAGWTQTSDTGQVNWSTVAVPASGAFVYEIWQPGDALQTGATKFFAKIQYGTSSGSPAGPRLKITLGTSTDGAGNINGFATSTLEPTIGGGNGQGSIVTYDCYFSGDTNRFGFILWRSLNAQGVPVLVTMERTHNTDGTDSTDGVSLVTGVGAFGGNASQQTLVFGVGAAPLSANVSYAALNDGNTVAAFNNKAPVSPVFPVYGIYGNPMTMVASVHTGDVGFGCQFTTTLYGATRNYIHAANLSINTPPHSYLFMRYD